MASLQPRSSENDALVIDTTWRYQRAGERTLKNSPVSAISLFRQKVVKN